MAEQWTNRWPRKVGYYWIWSPVLDDSFICEISGGAKGVAIVFYLSGEPAQTRDQIEEQYGDGCEWIGPLEAPEREA